MWGWLRFASAKHIKSSSISIIYILHPTARYQKVISHASKIPLYHNNTHFISREFKDIIRSSEPKGKENFHLWCRLLSYTFWMSGRNGDQAGHVQNLDFFIVHHIWTLWQISEFVTQMFLLLKTFWMAHGERLDECQIKVVKILFSLFVCQSSVTIVKSVWQPLYSLCKIVKIIFTK